MSRRRSISGGLEGDGRGCLACSWRSAVVDMVELAMSRTMEGCGEWRIINAQWMMNAVVGGAVHY